MKFQFGKREGRVDRRTTRVTIETDARAKRARDHLARKRSQERARIARQRVRAGGAGSRARTRSILTPVLFMLAFVVGLLTASPLSEVFLFRTARLEKIAVLGASALSPSSIARGSGLEAGRPLDTIDAKSIRNAVRAEPWIESVRSLRLPNGTVLISVVERQAVARWRADNSDETLLIDARGKRFAGSTNVGGALPLMRGNPDDNPLVPAGAMEILESLTRHVSLREDPTRLTLHLPRPKPAALKGGNEAGRSAGSDGDSGYVLQIGNDGPRVLLGKIRLSQRIARLAALLDSAALRNPAFDVADSATANVSNKNSDDSFVDTLVVDGTSFDRAAPSHKDANWIDLRYADRAVLRAEPVSG